MNINGFSSSISTTPPLGSRLDITVSEPATPHRTAPARTADTALQVGSISDVLNDAENLAIATAFQSTQPNTYTVEGMARARPMAPGVHLDLQA